MFFPFNEKDNNISFMNKDIQSQLNAVIQAFDGLMYVCSPDYRVEFMNQRLIERTGHDGTGEPCYQALHDRADICPWCVNERVFKGETVRWEVQSPKDNRWYYIVNTPIYWGDGTVSKQAMILDITDRKEAEAALKLHQNHLEELVDRRTREWMTANEELQKTENRYQTIFAATSAATVIIEEDMTISLVNSSFEKQSGYAKVDVEGKKKWVEFVTEKDLEKMKRYHEMRRINPDLAPTRYEFRFRDRQGRFRDIDATIAMIPGTKQSVGSFMDVTDQKNAERELKTRGKELEKKTQHLEELNTALKVLLQRREEDKTFLETNVLANMRELVLPYVQKLKAVRSKAEQQAYLQIIETNLNNIVSPFLRTLTAHYADFTPTEIRVANLIREGKTTKEISGLLHVADRSVEFHRGNIRRKLGMKNKKANLRAFLLSLQ